MALMTSRMVVQLYEKIYMHDSMSIAIDNIVYTKHSTFTIHLFNANIQKLDVAVTCNQHITSEVQTCSPRELISPFYQVRFYT